MNKLLKKALNKQKSGDARGAETLYRKILRDMPDDVDANYLLGALYAEQGDLSRALQFTERAALRAPNSPYIQNNLGNIHRLRGDLNAAQLAYERAIQVDPSLAEPYNNLGIVMKRLGDDARALDLYQQAIDRNPLFTQAHFNLGRALADAGRHEDAVECFRRALELQPSHVQALDGLGDACVRLGEHDMARASFEACLQLDSADRFGARVKLAYLNAAPIPAAQPQEWVRQTYETKALAWDANAAREGHEFYGPRHVAEAFKHSIGARAPVDVLDLGCGTGACGVLLRDASRRLVGVDLSAPMLDVARAKNVYDELYCADVIEFLSTQTATFDAVVASGVVIFFGDLLPLLRATAQTARPGGKMIFTTYRSDSDEVSVRFNFHFAHGAAHIRARAEEAGWRVESIAEVVHEREHGVDQPGFIVVLDRRE